MCEELDLRLALCSIVIEDTLYVNISGRDDDPGAELLQNNKDDPIEINAGKFFQQNRGKDG